MKTSDEDHERWITPGGDLDDRAIVLIVEDDRTLQSVMKYNLEREGYTVLTAGNGLQTLRIIEAQPAIDVVLLDIMLPELNGLALLPRLRPLTSASILVVSARGEEQDRIDGLELGADDYIVKPFGLRELLARVRAAVRRRGRPDRKLPATLYRGTLRLEPDNKRAFVDGRPLDLQRKEFGVLVTLALEPGRVFSRDELLDRVWGEDIIVDNRTVDVHVSWLRGKLIRAGGSGDMIQTVHGFGYRFIQEDSLGAVPALGVLMSELAGSSAAAATSAPKGVRR